MSIKAFMLYPGMTCLVGLLAIIGAFAEVRLLHKEETGKVRVKKFIFSVFCICLFAFLVLKFNHRAYHFFYSDDLNPERFIFGAIVTVLASAVKIGITLFVQKFGRPCTDEEIKKGHKALKVISVIFFSLGFSFFMFGHFVPFMWPSIRPEQMIVNVISPTKGTEIAYYLAGLEYIVLAVGYSVLFGIVCFARIRIEFLKKEKVIVLLSHTAKTILCFVLSLLVLITSVFYMSDSLSLPVMYKIFFAPTDFIEKNYVDLRDVKVTFPEQKRNLIFIYLESMENSYLSKDLGGYMDDNLIPELTALAQDGDVFSNSSGKFGGPMQITGTEWSMASMVNQTLGLPMKAPTSFGAYSTPGHFLGGAYGLGDLLHDNGYTQTFMVGATAVFGGVDIMYKCHGDFKVVDYDSARATGMIPSDYKVWWGFEDARLLSFAKEELTTMSQSGKPFNLILETIDTHATGGYLPDGAPTPYESHYANSIACNDHTVAEFVRWVQAQPFYENTTIIMIGDHHSMDRVFFADFDENYLRTTFNLILNPAPSLKNTDASRFVNRTYANFDMLPTTLAALGIEIEGNRAGIGTNLYSDEKTLLETYGVDYVDKALQNRSDFYNTTIVNG
ncbi:MAG: LTA synthase family protein [Clostridia bacterium]|nr:LTA synthase family protein [Clostridia bacterium]